MSIVVRPFRLFDQPEIEALHLRQGFEYDAPDWTKMAVSAVVEVNGEIQMAAFLRPTAETYLLLDPTQHVRRRERLGQLLMLHKEMLAPAKRAGFTDIHCWMPPEIEKRFGTLLTNHHFGWDKPLWPCYSLELK
jgi:hypothetical protein